MKRMLAAASITLSVMASSSLILSTRAIWGEESFEEARRRGFARITVIWEPGPDGFEAFFPHIGFTDVGETQYGEIIGALEL